MNMSRTSRVRVTVAVIAGILGLPIAIVAALRGGEPKTTQATEHTWLDLTDDLYHRIKAGLFVPECEPLLCGVEQRHDSARETGEGILGFLEIEWEEWRFAVAADEISESVVLYMSPEIVFGHIRIRPSGRGTGVARWFLPWPYHPVRRWIERAGYGLDQWNTGQPLARKPNESSLPRAVGMTVSELVEGLAVDDGLRTTRVVVVDESGLTIPFALIRLEWPDGPWIAIQADEKGAVILRVGSLKNNSDIRVWAYRKPIRQRLWQQPFDACSERLARAGLIVTPVP